MKDILLIGGGGHCKIVIDTITQGNYVLRSVINVSR